MRAASRALQSARGVLALWRMRSSAGTPTGLEPDLWIVAEAIVRSVTVRRSKESCAVASGALVDHA